MVKPLGKYHYEQIKGRTGGNGEWRVGDQDDDPVTDFATEAEAKAYVDEHNRKVEEYYAGSSS
jgi:hypothetical protein